MRLCSSIVLAPSRSSRAMARFISPTSHRRSAIRGGFVSRSWDSRSRKIYAERQRRFSPQSGQSATIHESGNVWFGHDPIGFADSMPTKVRRCGAENESGWSSSVLWKCGSEGLTRVRLPPAEPGASFCEPLKAA
jgi:hypothetical protein